MSDDKNAGLGYGQASYEEEEDSTMKKYTIDQAFQKIGGFCKNFN